MTNNDTTVIGCTRCHVRAAVAGGLCAECVESLQAENERLRAIATAANKLISDVDYFPNWNDEITSYWECGACHKKHKNWDEIEHHQNCAYGEIRALVKQAAALLASMKPTEATDETL